MQAFCLHSGVVTRTLTLREVPEPVVRELRNRARRNGRSMQSELLSIVRQATLDRRSFADQLANVRRALRRPLTLDEIHAAIDEGRP